MTGRAWATVLILGGLLTAQFTGGLDTAIETGQAKTVEMATSLRDVVQAPLDARQAQADELVAELELIEGGTPGQ